MSTNPNVPQYFRISGQIDTESEADQTDAYMEGEGPAHVANWPLLDDASVARDRERTERKQRRRALEFESGERRLRGQGKCWK